MFGFLKKRKYQEQLNPTPRGLSGVDQENAYSNLWRRIDEIEHRQFMIMDHLKISIESFPRVVKRNTGALTPMGIQSAGQATSAKSSISRR